MAAVLRRLKRSNKKAAKFKFTATLQELLLIGDEQWTPKVVVVTFMHRRRKVSSRERPTETDRDRDRERRERKKEKDEREREKERERKREKERKRKTFSRPEQCVIVWPHQLPETMDMLTTLYKGVNDDEYDDKEWTIVIEEVTEKKKRRPIAAVPINMRLFIFETQDEKPQLKLKLRPLVPHLDQCSLVIVLASQMVREGFGDDASLSSSVGTLEKTSREQSIELVDDHRNSKIGDAQAIAELANVSDTIQKEFGQPKTATDSSSMNTKKTTEPEPMPMAKAVRDEPIEVKTEQKTSVDGQRPPWRLSTEEKRRSTSNDPVQQHPERLPTENYFLVDEHSHAVPVVTPSPVSSAASTMHATSPTKGSSVPVHNTRIPSRESSLKSVPGEELLAWTQRATHCYHGVKIVDFTKSWRSGLALCALLHAYRPDVAPDYDNLDFSETANGRKSNLRKAFNASLILGITQRDLPDATDFLTPDSRTIKLFLERLRRIVEGVFDLPTPTSASDHRISMLYPVSESEMKVIDEINRIKESREAENAVDYRGVEDFSDGTPSYKPGPMSDISDDLDKPGTFIRHTPGRHTTATTGGVSVALVNPTLPNIRASQGRTPSPSKQEALRRKAREMIDNASSSQSSNLTVDERRRDEARRILEQVKKETRENTQGGSSFSTPTNLRRTPSTRSQNSLNGSQTDLRRIELVRPEVNIHAFKKRDPSPVIQRKRYDASEQPIIPAMKPTQMLADKLKTQNGASTPVSASGSGWTLDRVKRFGSMRSGELRESISAFTKQYGLPDPLSGSQQALDEFASPAKKVDRSQWERDVDEVERTSSEQAAIVQRLADVALQETAMRSKIEEAEKDSEEYEQLLDTCLTLTNEKNQLVGRQEYYNLIENIRETVADVKTLSLQLNEITGTVNDDMYKTVDEKEKTDRVMTSYMEAVERKDNLVQRLLAHEDEQRDDDERIKSMTLERRIRERESGTQFQRDTPVNASRRIINFFTRNEDQ